MSLKPPEKVGKLQAALHDKAKRSPGYRSYLLYDKVYRADVMMYAYECCRKNGGAPGEAVCTARTGIEMVALTAAAVAALTVYDMCKAVDRAAW